jgi:hypothetical protein
MSIIAKLETKKVTRTITTDPVQTRRDKLIASLNQQLEVWKYDCEGKAVSKKYSKWTVDADGSRVKKDVERTVKPTFFNQDGGWYVQCRYGSRVMNIYGQANAVWVKEHKDIGEALKQLIQAVKDGELDKSLAMLSVRKK